MQQTSIKKNAVYNAIKTCSAIIFPLITFPYISRVLQPENIGKINFAVAFIGYFSLIATLGITTYAVRECAYVKSDRDELEKTASQIYSINIYTTLIALTLLALSLVFFRKLDSYRTLIIIESTTILMATVGADWLNSAMEDFRYITIRTVAFQILSLLAMFLFVKKESDYIKYAVITVIATGGANLLNVFYRKRFCSVRFLTKNIDLKRHIKPVMLLFAMLLSQQILCNIDVTMLGLMRGDFDTGVYSTAVKIYNVVGQFVNSILWVLLPRLSNYFAEGMEEERDKLLRKGFSFLACVGIPCAIGIIVTSRDLVRIFAGDSYIGASSVLQILMVAFFISIFGGSFFGNLICLSAKEEKKFLWACVEAMIANVILNYVLIKKMGINGAAIATAASALIILISLVVSNEVKFDIGPVKNIVVAPLIGGALIVGVTSIVKTFNLVLWAEFILCAVSGAMVYGLTLLISKYELIGDLTNKNR